MKRFREGLVFKAYHFVYHSTLGTWHTHLSYVGSGFRDNRRSHIVNGNADFNHLRSSHHTSQNGVTLSSRKPFTAERDSENPVPAVRVGRCIGPPVCLVWVNPQGMNPTPEPLNPNPLTNFGLWGVQPVGWGVEIGSRGILNSVGGSNP